MEQLASQNEEQKAATENNINLNMQSREIRLFI